MRKLSVKLLIMTLIGIVAIGLTACGKQSARQGSTAPANSKITVVATTYPVYEFAKQVGGDKIELIMLMAPGVEPHNWEPTAKDFGRIRASKLVLYHGAGLEQADKILNKEVLGSTKAVAVSQGIPLLKEDDEADEEGHGHDSHNDDHAKSTQSQHNNIHSHDVDPHMWLDPVYAQQEVNNIAQALGEVDAANKDYYLTNAAQYNAELAKLDQEYRTKLAAAANKEIVTSHAAFGYLTKRYNLHQSAIMGLAADAEPTPERMAKLVNFCRDHKVKYIFFEALVSPKLAETIARETGAGLLVLNPLENLTNEEIKQGKDYLSVMRDNLANLEKALQ